MFGKKKEDIQTVAPSVENPVKTEEIAAEPIKTAPTKTIIGKDVVVVGNFDAKESIEVYGTIRGNVRSAGSLFVAEDGSLIGEAAVESLVVDGKIEGTVLCSDVASLSKSAKMKGNLSTAALKTEDGSIFEGKLNMIAKKAQPEPEIQEEFEEEAKADYEADYEAK